MDDVLLSYYEQELTFIREMGAEFARKYPKIAGRLLLEQDKCEDPHTERLIEAFALISGRIHQKIKDDFPEITESLLNIIYPHYINPIPSVSVVAFSSIRQNIPPSGYRLDKDTAMFSKPVNGTPCRFTTCYPVDLWPVEVVSAEVREPAKTVKGAQQVLSIRLKTFGNLKMSQLKWRTLRFFLNAPSQHVYHMYELLFNNVCHVELRVPGGGSGKETVILSPEDIKPVGFAPEEGMMPFSKRSFPGYLLLFEYFCFPEKFLFFDLCGLEKSADMKGEDTLDILIYLDRIGKSTLVVDKDTFCLNAAPAANLFSRIAEPIRIEGYRTEYRVVPDLRRQDGTEVFSIDQVSAPLPASPGKSFMFRPFYSLHHHLDEDDLEEKQVFWHLRRRASGRKDDRGSEVFLSFTDLNFNPADPGVEIVTIHTTCTNRDLPSRLPFGDPEGDFSLETAAPVSRITCLLKPTPTIRSPQGAALQWRFISHLSLNYLSIVQGGKEALQEILTLYDFKNSPTTRQQIKGIASLDSRHVTKRMGRAFCRGVEVKVTFDESKYVGTGLFLFACILERFLGQYVSVNSFSQLIAETIQRKESLRIWPPRNGNRTLL
ncbi:MAG: type VI secretion system baseplate subunit TssF [Desulfatiglandales bacterium]